jgi:prolyl 4-hydroxylase
MSYMTFFDEPSHPDSQRLKVMGNKVRGNLANRIGVEAIKSEMIELWIVRNFLAPDVCRDFRALIDNCARPGQSPSFRSSSYAHLDQNLLAVQSVQKRIDELIGIDQSFAEPIQGQRYSTGQRFRTHIDWFQEKSPSWKLEESRGGQRSFTTMVFLNDVEQGGETEFHEAKIILKPRTGSLIIWNNAKINGTPSGCTAHSGNPVLSSEKYILTRWYRCNHVVIN